MALLLVAGLIAAGGAALLVSPLYRLRQLVVRGPGASWVTERALGLDDRTSLLAVRPSQMASRALRVDPLAKAAHAAVDYPHTLRIALRPRVSVCLVWADSGDAGVWGADPSGMLIPVTAAQRSALPFCTGVPRAGPDLRVDASSALKDDLEALRALPAGLSGSISEVHGQGQSMTLVLSDGRPVRVGLPVSLAAKEALLPELLKRYPWPEYAGVGFDLRNPKRPALFGLP